SIIPGMYPAASHQLATLDEFAEPSRERRADVLSFDGELDGRLQIVQRIADVEAPMIEAVRVDGLILREQVDRVGQLDLAAVTRLRAPERVEDLRSEHVAPDRGEVRGSLFLRRFFHDRDDPDQVLVDGLGVDAAVP